MNSRRFSPIEMLHPLPLATEQNSGLVSIKSEARCAAGQRFRSAQGHKQALRRRLGQDRFPPQADTRAITSMRPLCPISRSDAAALV
jgi:hypothetical protein